VLKPLTGEGTTDNRSDDGPISRAQTPLSPGLFTDGGRAFGGRRAPAYDDAAADDDENRSPVSPRGTGDGYLAAATLQRWHYEPLLLDEALDLLASFCWDADRLKLWRAWLTERPQPPRCTSSSSHSSRSPRAIPSSSASGGGGGGGKESRSGESSGILNLEALVEHHFAELTATFSSPVSRLRLQDMLRELRPDWRFTPPSW
jgi:hypothetical protein